MGSLSSLLDCISIHSAQHYCFLKNSSFKNRQLHSHSSSLININRFDINKVHLSIPPMYLFLSLFPECCLCNHPVIPLKLHFITVLYLNPYFSLNYFYKHLLMNITILLLLILILIYSSPILVGPHCHRFLFLINSLFYFS